MSFRLSSSFMVMLKITLFHIHAFRLFKNSIEEKILATALETVYVVFHPASEVVPSLWTGMHCPMRVGVKLFHLPTVCFSIFELCIVNVYLKSGKKKKKEKDYIVTCIYSEEECGGLPGGS